MNHDVNSLWIVCPCVLNYTCKIVDNSIEVQGVDNIACVNFSKGFRKVLDELLLFITVLDNGLLSDINIFFNQWNDNS